MRYLCLVLYKKVCNSQCFCLPLLYENGIVLHLARIEKIKGMIKY